MADASEAAAAVSARLLELAAEDDAAALGDLLAAHPSLADEPAPWYSPARGAEPMTPLMVAAAYGSVSCLEVLLSPPHLVDPNRASPASLSTALHLAAAGGSSSAPAAVSRLLAAGADPTLLDHLQRRPSDLVALPPNSLPLKNHLLSLLGARKEWPPDPSLPDIKNGAYASDDFRMYSFKVRACSRAYSHDWTECPFVHPGENARRRDPRKYHYSCVPCPEFKKGAGCRRGDMCEYAHGVFESWLHPAQYRTRLCKDGVGCARRVCFFAHTPEELRPLYVSSAGSRSAMEMAAAMGMGLPSPGASFTPPLSPSGGGTGVAGAWPQPNVPALCLPGSAGNLHLSRLRTSLSARSMAVDELLASADYDGLVGSPASVRSARGKTLVPSNLDDLFSSEMAGAAASHSPRYADQGGAAFSPTRKAAMLNQFQQQQSLLSPRATAATIVPEPVSPMSSRLLAALAQREKMQQQTLRSMSSRDLGSDASVLVGSPVTSSWSKWGIPSGTPNWGADDEELGGLKRSSSFELRSGANGDEPDLSWVNTLVKEPTPEKPSINGTTAIESIGTLSQATSHEGIIGGDEDNTAGVIGGWLEQLQLDEMVV